MESLVKVTADGTKVYCRLCEDYTLDKHDFINIHIASPKYFSAIADTIISFETYAQIVRRDGTINPKIKNGKKIYIPLYGYVHSGSCVSTKPFPYKFDSGFIGVIVIDKETVRSTYNCSRITKKIQERIDKEIQEYISLINHFLFGSIYEVVEESKDGYIETTVCVGYTELEETFNRIV